MAKFNPILMQKVQEEQKEEEKQARLKEETGIESDNVAVKEKGVKEYAKDILKCILYILFITLVFIGIITLLNPASRQVIMEALSRLVPSGGLG